MTTKSRLHLPERIRHTALGDEIQRMLREGEPTLGWSGDPYLTLTYNRVTGEFEVWDEHPKHLPFAKMVCRKHGSTIDGDAITLLLVGLRNADLRKKTTDEYISELEAQFDKEDAALDAQTAEFAGESAEHLAFQMEKDLGHKSVWADWNAPQSDASQANGSGETGTHKQT